MSIANATAALPRAYYARTGLRVVHRRDVCHIAYFDEGRGVIHCMTHEADAGPHMGYGFEEIDVSDLILGDDCVDRERIAKAIRACVGKVANANTELVLA